MSTVRSPLRNRRETRKQEKEKRALLGERPPFLLALRSDDRGARQHDAEQRAAERSRQESRDRASDESAHRSSPVSGQLGCCLARRQMMRCSKLCKCEERSTCCTKGNRSDWSHARRASWPAKKEIKGAPRTHSERPQLNRRSLRRCGQRSQPERRGASRARRRGAGWSPRRRPFRGWCSIPRRSCARPCSRPARRAHGRGRKGRRAP